MKQLRYIGLMTAVVLMVTSPSLSSAEKPIKIGTIVALTGFMAPDALESVKGIELKLNEVGYEVAGRQIELIKEDHSCDPTKAVDKARKLVENDNVDVILGPLFSPAWYAVANYLKRSRTPNIGFMMNPADILQFGGKNVFLTLGTLVGKGYYLGAYAYDDLGYRTATIFQPDVLHAEQWMDGFTQAFKERGGSVIQRQRVPPDALDFSAYFISMKKADTLVFWQHGPFVAPFLTQYRDSGLKMPLMIPCTSPADERALAEVGDATLGMVGSTAYTPLIDTAASKRFVNAFLKRYGYYPSKISDVSGYISATIYLEAVKATGGDTSFNKINKTILKLKVNTPAGPYSYTPEGLGIGNLYIVRVEKVGDRYAWKPVYQYEQIVLDKPK